MTPARNGSAYGRLRRLDVANRTRAGRPVSEAEAIAHFIAAHGVVRCPTAYAAPSVQGAQPDRQQGILPQMVLVQDRLRFGFRFLWRRLPA